MNIGSDDPNRETPTGTPSAGRGLEPAYWRHLRRRVEESLVSRGSSLSTLVRYCDGAYPTDVRTVLTELGHLGFENRRNSTAQPAITKTARVSSSTLPVVLPEPHPADYDWRFTTDATELLVNDILSFGKSTRIALFGAPTLFRELRLMGADATLFDRNPRTIERLHQRWPTAALVQADLFSPVPCDVGVFDLVLADPPWYVDFFQAFVLRAAQALRDGGTLILSMLPWLTRPEAVRDRAAVLAFAVDAGFDLRDCRSGAIGYESPRFEQQALATQGIVCTQWRYGDLYWFRKTADPLPTLTLHRSELDYEWDTFEVGAQQIKLKHERGLERGKFTCRPVAKTGRVFDSVSRRAPSRRRIDLWTSGNLAYAVTGAAVLPSVLLALQKGRNSVEVLERASRDFDLSQDETAMLQRLLDEIGVPENDDNSGSFARGIK